jgi:hypothetical protein
MPAYVSLRQHTSAYLLAPHASAILPTSPRLCHPPHLPPPLPSAPPSPAVDKAEALCALRARGVGVEGSRSGRVGKAEVGRSLRVGVAGRLMSGIRQHHQHTSAYVSIRQHTSAYVSIRQHTSAYVSIRQHTSAYVSIRKYTWLRRGG